MAVLLGEGTFCEKEGIVNKGRVETPLHTLNDIVLDGWITALYHFQLHWPIPSG